MKNLCNINLYFKSIFQNGAGNTANPVDLVHQRTW